MKRFAWSKDARAEYKTVALRFLLGDFDALTKRLEKYLRATEEDMADPVFAERSTVLMLYVIAVALSQIGDYDEIGKFSASYIPDGDVQFSVKGSVGATIRVKDHVLSTIKARPENPRAIMEFESLELARALFDGKVNALACIGNGSIAMHGMINMIDNLNRAMMIRPASAIPNDYRSMFTYCKEKKKPVFLTEEGGRHFCVAFFCVCVKIYMKGETINLLDQKTPANITSGGNFVNAMEIGEEGIERAQKILRKERSNWFLKTG